MDAATVRTMLERNLELSGRDPEAAHGIYTDDAVLEFPQSGERIVGVENFRGDRIARETIYVTEGFEAPEWRTRWRVAP